MVPKGRGDRFTRSGGQPFREVVTSAKEPKVRRATGNIGAIQILLGHTKIEDMVRYLGVDIEDALILAESTGI